MGTAFSGAWPVIFVFLIRSGLAVGGVNDDTVRAGSAGSAGSAVASKHSGAQPPSATVVGGFIFRDEETREDIERSATFAIEPGSGGGLELVVTKSRYRLDAIRNGVPVKTYPIAMGRAPDGPKDRQGDNRTPEGEYVLIPHHASGKFGRCFYISYPNERDVEKAVRARLISRSAAATVIERLVKGEPPPHTTKLGGLILLHGTKDRSIGHVTKFNWTLGCIAMENDAIEELLAAFTRLDRPLLVIRP